MLAAIEWKYCVSTYLQLKLPSRRWTSVVASRWKEVHRTDQRGKEGQRPAVGNGAFRPTGRDPARGPTPRPPSVRAKEPGAQISGSPSLTQNAVRAEIARMPTAGARTNGLGSGGGRQRHTDDTVADRKNHNRVPEEVKGSPASRGKKHHRYPRQEHERHSDGQSGVQSPRER